MRVSFVLTAALLLTVAIGIGIPYSAKPARPKSLILISLDTLRADRLGTYGYKRRTSPAIDAFAKHSIVFDEMTAVSSWTLPTHLTVLTGLYPTSHGITHWKKGALSTNHQLLAEILRRDGFRTAAITGGGYVGKRYGFARGFQSYSQVIARKHPETGAFPVIVRKAADFLKHVSSDDPYFLFLHTYDIHCPYEPPERYRSAFLTRGAKRTPNTACLQGKRKRNTTFSSGERRYLSDMYDASIRLVDDGFSQLLRVLRARDDFKDTVIVIFSDHGEELFEHGRHGHEGTLYRELIHVPTIIRAPGFAARRVAVPTSQVDLFATMLQLIGVNAELPLDGSSLVPAMRGDPTPIRPFQFSELDWHANLRSRWDDEHHLILNQETNQSELFDVVEDPKELQSLVSSKSGLAANLEGELSMFMQQLVSSEPAEMEAETEEQVEELKSLGYI